jgi:glycosyl transferase family 25
MACCPECYEPRWAERRSGYRLSASEMACFMSHRLAWWACATEDRPVLVLEDDFLLRPSFVASIRGALAARETWDILRMQELIETNAVAVARHDGTVFVKNLADPWGATAYIAQPASARRLLAHSRRIIEPVDTFLERSRQHGQRLLAVLPYPVTVTGSPSSMTDRPIRYGVRGWKRRWRSCFRLADQLRNLLVPPAAVEREPPTCW